MNIHAHLSTLEVIGLLGGTVVSEDGKRGFEREKIYYK